MANLNTLTLGDFTRLAGFIYEKEQARLPQNARKSGLFKIDLIPDHSGDTREYNEIDTENYAANKAEGDQASLARVQVGYSKILTLVRRGFDQTISWEMRTRNKYPEVVQRLTSLARACTDRLELDLTHRITFGTSTSYVDKDGATVTTTIGDGLALFSTVHTLRGSSTTFRNLLANNPQLSRGSMESMEKMRVENTLNHFGEKMASTDDILYTSDDPNTINTARELLQSTASVSGPHEGIVNVYKAKYTHVVLPLLATDKNGAVDSTKNKYWGLASSRDCSGYLAVNQEATMNAPQMGSNAADVSTEDWTYTSRCSYGIVIVGGRYISLSKGNGDA